MFPMFQYMRYSTYLPKKRAVGVGGAFLIAQLVKSLPAVQETLPRFLHLKDPLAQGIATQSRILTRRMGSQKVGHN